MIGGCLIDAHPCALVIWARDMQWHPVTLLLQAPGACFNMKIIFPGIGILIIKIRQWHDHLTSILGIPILVRWYFYIGTDPRWQSIWYFFLLFLNYPKTRIKIKTPADTPFSHCCMKSSNGNIFLNNGPLWGNPLVTSGFHSLMFSFICTWTNVWVNNWNTGDLRCHCIHFNITSLQWIAVAQSVSLWYYHTNISLMSSSGGLWGLTPLKFGNGK